MISHGFILFVCRERSSIFLSGESGLPTLPHYSARTGNERHVNSIICWCYTSFTEKVKNVPVIEL